MTARCPWAIADARWADSRCVGPASRTLPAADVGRRPRVCAGHPRPGRRAHPSGLRRRPIRRGGGPPGRRALQRRRDPAHRGSDARRVGRRAALGDPSAGCAAPLAGGTTTVECKSGYGLSTTEELRALRLIGEAAAQRADPRRAHLPGRPRRARNGDIHGRVRRRWSWTRCSRRWPAAGSAEFCDVFCDAGFFSLDGGRADPRRGCAARARASECTPTSCHAPVAPSSPFACGATSADHLEQLDAAGVAALAGSSTVATLLPGPAVVLRDRLPPARALLDAGATVALASDANAGTFGGLGRDAAGDRAGGDAARR